MVKDIKKTWVELLSKGEIEQVWERLFKVVSNHSSVRKLFASGNMSYQTMVDAHGDLTQDLFLKLFEKDRFRYYIESGYSDEKVDREIYRFEIPNLISRLMRERFPESYRIARRTSEILKTGDEFQYYPHLISSSNRVKAQEWMSASRKLVLQIYGLKGWPLDKAMRDRRQIAQMASEVNIRLRNNQRTGRGEGSQVIISNTELSELIVNIFEVTDSPVDVQMMRSLVLSKLMVEDSEFISIDAGVTLSSDTDQQMPGLDIADERPTPEEILLDKEQSRQVEELVSQLFERMEKAVKYKQRRLNKLLRVVWNCYFNPSSPSQSGIAKVMGVSDSLVSYYRKIFDEIVESLKLTDDEFILFNSAMNDKLMSFIAALPAEKQAKSNGKGKKSEIYNTGELVARYQAKAARASCCGD